MSLTVIVINNVNELEFKFPKSGEWVFTDPGNIASMTIYGNGNIHGSEGDKTFNVSVSDAMVKMKGGKFPNVIIGPFNNSYESMKWMSQHCNLSQSKIIEIVTGTQDTSRSRPNPSQTNHTTWQRPMPSARHMRGFNSGHGFGRIVGILGEEITSTSLAQNAADVVKATEQAVVNDVLPTVSQAVTQTSQSVQQALSPQATPEQSNRMKYIAIGAGLLLLYLVIKK
jgi:hypothetical protein